MSTFCALEQILATLWCQSAVLWFSFPVQEPNLPVESQLKLGETHCCMRRDLHMVDSTEASRVLFYHQSWKPVSQQSLRSASPGRRRAGCFWNSPHSVRLPGSAHQAGDPWQCCSVAMESTAWSVPREGRAPSTTERVTDLAREAGSSRQVFGNSG